MWTLKPHQPALQVTNSTIASEPIATAHLHSSAAEQNPQELLHTPCAAQPLQQPPRVPHRKFPTSHPAGPHTHFQLQATARDSYIPGGCSRLQAGSQAQHQPPHTGPESHLLQLLINSNPVRSADELLARLRSAAITEATPTPARRTEFQEHQRTPNTSTCHLVSNRHDGSVTAPPGSHPTVSDHVMGDSPTLLNYGSWVTAAPQQIKLGRHEKSSSSSHTWGPAAVRNSNHSGADNTAGMCTAGSAQDDALANSPSKLHAPSIPFAASSAQANVNSYYCQTASGYPEYAGPTHAGMICSRSTSCSRSFPEHQRRPLFMSSFDLLSNPSSSLLACFNSAEPVYAAQERSMLSAPSGYTDDDILASSRNTPWA